MEFFSEVRLTEKQPRGPMAQLTLTSYQFLQSYLCGITRKIGLVTLKRETEVNKQKNDYRRKEIIQGTARNVIHTDALLLKCGVNLNVHQ